MLYSLVVERNKNYLENKLNSISISLYRAISPNEKENIAKVLNPDQRCQRENLGCPLDTYLVTNNISNSFVNMFNKWLENHPPFLKKNTPKIKQLKKSTHHAHPLLNQAIWNIQVEQSSAQIIIFHQPRFPSNKGISLPVRYLLGAQVVWSRCNLTRTIPVTSKLRWKVWPDLLPPNIP